MYLFESDFNSLGIPTFKRYLSRLDYYQKAYDIQDELGNPGSMAFTLANIGKLCCDIPDISLIKIGVKPNKRYEKYLEYINKSLALVLNILPVEVTEELKAEGVAEAQLIDDATVLFTDFKGFTGMSQILTAKELVADRNHYFTAFDEITHKHRIEKIKTIGDVYMAAGGLPTPNTTHAKDVVLAALEIRDFIEEGKAEKIAAGLPYFEIRIGIHTGPLVAGIVGVKKFQYDIWGDTVNTASRMESAGEEGKVNISEFTYELLKEDPDFKFEFRGNIEVKGKGKMGMWFVKIKNEK